MELPYKKMIREKSFLGFSAQCDCGHKHDFSTKDLDINTKNLSEVKFKKVYTCPKCESKYDGMFDMPKSKWWEDLSPTGILLSLLLLIGLSVGGYEAFKWATDSSDIEMKEQIIIDQQNKWEENN